MRYAVIAPCSSALSASASSTACTREADMAASLWHPFIVSVHDRGEFEGQLWIAKHSTTPTITNRCTATEPANILPTEPASGRRRILLADFGIARQANEASGLTAANVTVGSDPYAAPEPLTGDVLDG